jgi:hypothetical protein
MIATFAASQKKYKYKYKLKILLLLLLLLLQHMNKLPSSCTARKINTEKQ